MKLKLLAFSVLAVFLFSCEKYDRKPPTIETINISGQTFNINLVAGEVYALDYTITDNKQIRDVQIRTLKGFRSEENVEKFQGDFSFSTGFDPDNSVKSEPLRFPIPANVKAGSYRVSINARDGNGNDSPERNLNFIINHPDAPEAFITVSSTFGDSINPASEIRRGDRIFIKGTASSPSDITRVKVELLGENQSEFSLVYPFPGANDNSIDFEQLFSSTVFKVPASTMSGFNDLLISVTAANGHTRVITYRYKVLF